MGQYVNLCLRTSVYNEIIDDLMFYCTQLDNYYEIESCIHLIDHLNEEYQFDMNKQNKEFQQWQEYEKLFAERFKDENGCINKKGVNEYENFDKINKILEDYKEEGTLDILDTKQQFFLVLDLINAIGGDL